MSNPVSFYILMSNPVSFFTLMSNRITILFHPSNPVAFHLQPSNPIFQPNRLYQWARVRLYRKIRVEITGSVASLTRLKL